MDKVANLDNQTIPKGQSTTAESSSSHDTPPLTHIQYAETIRFQPPKPVNFSVAGSIGSILSLVFMSVMASFMFIQLYNPTEPTNTTLWSNILNALGLEANASALPAWVWLPFAFTIFGSTLGWLFEAGLLLAARPFQQQITPSTRFISKVRFLNLAPVATTLLFFTCALTLTSSGLREAALFIACGLTLGLGFALFFGTRSPALPLTLLGLQVIQAVIILATMPTIGGTPVTLMLLAQATLQFTALLIGTATPMRSTLFHVISTFAGISLFAAILTVTQMDATYAQAVAPNIELGSLTMWGLVAIALAGLAITIKALPDAYNNFRAGLSNTVWTPLYFKLISAERFPDPVNLSDVYNNNPPKSTTLKPYYQVHPQHLMKNLSIPAVATQQLERNVKVFKKLLKQAKSAFSLISWLDHNLPQANINEPIKNKPRLSIWSDGRDYWPNLFRRTLFGAKMPNQGDLQPAPSLAITRFEQGQLLAYLAESGVGNPFLQRSTEHTGLLVMDLRFLEKYRTKSDYETYGGAAFFQINAEQEQLELVFVIAPKTETQIPANPNDPQFRRAESMILASMYYQVISGKHLAEIHMTYNLVEVSMHNAFDAQGQWRHPFRTFMYLHFFSHELAEEITTEHLVQEGAVFSQIFATTHDAMINHLNDTYAEFEYGTDEAFETRAALMKMPNGERLPNACINWELDYFEIWHRYTTDLIDIIYQDDQAVADDVYVQDFYSGLQQVLLKGLPERYQLFKTKQGLARFAADTMHHTVVRHQVYGTTGIRAALDPRISSTQIPLDSGTPAVDEWRSLAYVAQATGEARFTLLTGPKGKDFTYLLRGVDDKYRQPMAKVFDRLQQDLQALDKQWSEDDVEKTFNYTYFRAVPSELHTGPGY